VPSEKVLQQKKEIVRQLSENMKSAKTIVFADYRGLTVEQDTELRNKLRKAGVEYKVVKNTLTKLAAKKMAWKSWNLTLTVRLQWHSAIKML